MATERYYVSRGVLILFSEDKSRLPYKFTVIKPAAWRGKILTFSTNYLTLSQLNTFTYGLGMPRVHWGGGRVPYFPDYYFAVDKLYKISEISKATEIAEQTQRLKNLKTLLEKEPNCKLDKVPDNECAGWEGRHCIYPCVMVDGICKGGNFKYDYSALDEINGTPPRPVGTRETLELCPDGAIKRYRIWVPGGYKNTFIEVYRGAVIFRYLAAAYGVIYYDKNGSYKQTTHSGITWIRTIIDRNITEGGKFQVGTEWLEFSQTCTTPPPPPPPEKSKVTFTVEASGVGRVAGAKITINGTSLTTNASGEASFMAENGKSYKSYCAPPAGYACVVCTSDFTAPKSVVSFVLKKDTAPQCTKGDIKPGSTVYCKDGVTWQARQVCDASGNWTLVTNTCPDGEEEPPPNGMWKSITSMLCPVFDFVENTLGVDRKTAETYTYYGLIGIVIVVVGAMFVRK